ncbi:MAG: serine/threonine-protein phosphatase [Verrucomicrobia bacterium]|nr:serine/threonine-protein phosphatase [Kiritimatiellia bacterium]MCP5489462.1 serine/threonine-protein phosphatase [Verrucomicrobiota bacterium]
MLEAAAITDIGICRVKNQDAYVVMPGAGVYCVADGIGGGWKGERASATAVQALMEAFVDEQRAPHDFTERIHHVEEAFREASRAIRAYTREDGQRASGTTAVAMVFNPASPRQACILHAGDSRAYRFRGQTLTTLTRDHTMLADAGFDDEETFHMPLRNVVTRAVGIADNLTLDETEIDVEDGDVYLLCSDGLSSMLTHMDIEQTLRDARGRDLETTVSALVEKALWAGGLDNITIILIRVDHACGIVARIRRWWRTRHHRRMAEGWVQVSDDADAVA